MQPTIVVVDDAPLMLRLVGQYLKVLGVRTLNCPNGAVAYHVIAQARPQAVILEINMPDVDGIEVFQKMRADPVTRMIPVIFFTFNAQPLWERLPSFESQAAYVVSKMNLAELTVRVQQVLAGRIESESTAVGH